MTRIEKIAAIIFAAAMFCVIGIVGKADTGCIELGKLITGVLICLPIMGGAVAVICHEEAK